MHLQGKRFLGFREIRVTFLLLVISTIGLGCGATSDRAQISGKVLLDGKPLDQGSIQFEPAEGTSKLNAGGVISDGAYQIPAAQGVPPGKYRVAITSFPKDTRKAEDVMNNPGPPPKERIAEKYNAASTTIVEVTKGGKNQFDFQVESAPQ